MIHTKFLTKSTLQMLCITLVLSSVSPAVSIDTVYFAQTHVQKADAAYPIFVGNRDTLIKVHVTDPATPASPTVTAQLNLGGATHTITLTGPATLPASIPDGPGVVEHSFDNTFTATIPAAWVADGLTVTVNAGAATSTIDNLDISAPNPLTMTCFNINFFRLATRGVGEGWEAEQEAKLPVSSLTVHKAPHVVFNELVMLPRTAKNDEDVRIVAPAIRSVSRADYTAQSGIPFDGNINISNEWNRVLRNAAGRGQKGKGYHHLFMLNGNPTPEGFGKPNYTSVSTGLGVMWHEVGHGFGLGHVGDSATYPYKGDMFGISAPSTFNGAHAGPTWAYDLPSQTFIPCTTGPGNTGTFTREPMQSGNGDPVPPFGFGHFSDHSVWRIRNNLENSVIVWNESLGQYAKWSDLDKDYTQVVPNNGIDYPLQRDQEVITLMAAVSGASPEVCMAYPPIGPYTAGIIRLFDPSNPTDRADAQSIGYAPSGGCDVTLRVTQGGVVNDYMLSVSYDENADPLDPTSLLHDAINLPAANGEVTRVELLLTPDAEINGLPANPQELYSWSPAKSPVPVASFDQAPTTVDGHTITMTANVEVGDSDFNGRVQYMFTETTGNLGGSSSAWQDSPTYVDYSLRPNTEYRYTVKVRSQTSEAESLQSPEASATTTSSNATKTILTTGGDGSWQHGRWTAGVPWGTIDACIQAGVAADINTHPEGWVGTLVLENGASLRIGTAGETLVDGITHLTLNNATIHDSFSSDRTFGPIVLNGGGRFESLNTVAVRDKDRFFDGVISGNGGLSIVGEGLNDYEFNTTNTFTGGLIIGRGKRYVVRFNAPGSAGKGDVTLLRDFDIVEGEDGVEETVLLDSSPVISLGANDVFSPDATLRLEGKGWNNTNLGEYQRHNTILDMNEFNAEVSELYIDGVKMPVGRYPGTEDKYDWIDGTGFLLVTGGGVANPPTAVASFDVLPNAIDGHSISMTANIETGDSEFNGMIQYLFTETTGNYGGSTSGWQESPTYVDSGLRPNTEYRYTVTVRSGISHAESSASAEAAATTPASTATETTLTTGGAQSWQYGVWTTSPPWDNVAAVIQAGVAAQIDSSPAGWSGPLSLEEGASLRINTHGAELVESITQLTLNNATIHDTFGGDRSFGPIVLNGGGRFDSLNDPAGRYNQRLFDGQISGNGGLSITGRALCHYVLNTTNTFTDGLVINRSSRYFVSLDAPGAAGQGDVTLLKELESDQGPVINVNANDVFSPSATLRLEGKGWAGTDGGAYSERNTILDMNGFNATVAELYIDGVQWPVGRYLGTEEDKDDWIDGTGALTVTGGYAPNPPAEVGIFAVLPTALDSQTITMTANVEVGDNPFNGMVQYLFTETSGNLGGSSSGWQDSPTYVDDGLLAETEYRYTVTVRSGISLAESSASAEAAATTLATTATETILTTGGADSWQFGEWSAGIPTGTINAVIDAGVAAEIDSNPAGWSGPLSLEEGASLRINTNGAELVESITQLTLNNATIHDTFHGDRSFGPIVLNGGGSIDILGDPAGRYNQRLFDGQISGNGGLRIAGRALCEYLLSTTNTFTGGLVIDRSFRYVVSLDAPGAAGQGDVTLLKDLGSNQGPVIRINANDVFSPTATLRLDGSGWDGADSRGAYSGRHTVLDMNGFNATVARLILDGVEQAPGQYQGTDANPNDWIDGTGVLTVTGVPDYNSWIANYPSASGESGFGDDPDGDGIKNGLENYFGTDPTQTSTGIMMHDISGNVLTFRHPLNSLAASDVSASYHWSTNLTEFHNDGATNGEGLRVSFSVGAPINGIVDVTATITSGSVPENLFVRLGVTQTGQVAENQQP